MNTTRTAATIALGSTFTAHDGTVVTVHAREAAVSAELVLLHVSEDGGPIEVHAFGVDAAL